MLFYNIQAAPIRLATCNAREPETSAQCDAIMFHFSRGMRYEATMKHRYKKTGRVWIAIGLLLAGPGVARAAPDRSCAAAKEPWAADAIAEAHKLLGETWLAVGDNRYTAFALKAPPANPFDLAARKSEPAQATPRGFIWIGGLNCTVTAAEPDRSITLSFEAGALSFNENGEGWTRPMRNAKLTQVIVVREGTGWKASEQRTDYSALLPEEKLRKPAAEELPAANAKLKIPCNATQHWRRSRCVTAAAALKQK